MKFKKVWVLKIQLIILFLLSPLQQLGVKGGGVSITNSANQYAFKSQIKDFTRKNNALYCLSQTRT
jgi:exopolysaccharide biosynthesis protein